MLIVDEFDWDDGNWPKCGSHGVTKAEIESLFGNDPLIVPDPFPHENRLRAIGKAGSGRHVYCVFTLRETRLRPISARFMHEKEVQRYEQERAKEV